jgi:hypothetical protein
VNIEAGITRSLSVFVNILMVSDIPCQGSGFSGGNPPPNISPGRERFTQQRGVVYRQVAWRA